MFHFAHHRLDAYRVALDLAHVAITLANDLPRGHAAIADQLRRSATALPLLIAEGANRVSPAQKRQRFIEARGECGEAAAAIELLAKLRIVDAQVSAHALESADRVGAMLSGLLKKLA
jgi:four helix bundle protein